MSANKFNGLITSLNGDTVIGFTSAKQMKTAGFMDKAKFHTYLQNEEAGQSHRKNLGLINLFGATHNVNVPIMRDLFANSAVLEVEPGQTVTYDLPVTRVASACLTTSDTSEEQDFPGLDGSVFAIELSEQFTKGDVLGYDLYDGEQVMVSNDHEVEQVGENFRHYVVLSTNDKTKWFPKDKLRSGVEYFKVTNVLGEYDTDYSNINMMKNPAGTITNEFVLGDPRGVETMYTNRVANIKSAGMTAFSENMRERVMTNLDRMGGKDMFFIAKHLGNGQYDRSSIKIGTTMEYLALMELAMMEANSLLFAKAGTFRTATGTKSINEGLWHQYKRGKVIKYAKPGGLTMNHIHEAASYVYKNSSIPVANRRLKFKVGSMMKANLMQLFREEALHQLSGIPSGMLGESSQIGKPVFTGDLNNLTMNAVQITSVQVPGVGYIEFELDESLDFQPFADRQSAGFFGGGVAKTSYSALIYDATDPYYSNVNDVVKGAKLVEGGNARANTYYVKPEGPNVVYGYEQGRMANGEQFENVQTSLKYAGRNFWATSHSAALVTDTTRFVSIELQSL
jgi:hypothetical protein